MSDFFSLGEKTPPQADKIILTELPERNKAYTLRFPKKNPNFKVINVKENALIAIMSPNRTPMSTP
jgi:hypothetical protein